MIILPRLDLAVYIIHEMCWQKWHPKLSTKFISLWCSSRNVHIITQKWALIIFISWIPLFLRFSWLNTTPTYFPGYVRLKQTVLNPLEKSTMQRSRNSGYVNCNWKKNKIIFKNAKKKILLISFCLTIANNLINLLVNLEANCTDTFKWGKSWLVSHVN